LRHSSARRVYHGYVRGENIIVRHDQSAVVVDFDMSKVDAEEDFKAKMREATLSWQLVLDPRKRDPQRPPCPFLFLQQQENADTGDTKWIPLRQRLILGLVPDGRSHHR
jgi:hypothetical protein